MAGHEHTNRCYWDFTECRWVCRPARAEDDPMMEFAGVTVSADESVGAATDRN